MKKFAVLILSLAFIFIPFSAAYAASGVYDNAGLLYETELNAVSEELAALSEATGWDAAAVTVSDTEGKSSAVYADDFYSGLGYGDNGIIYLIDMDNREIYISAIGTASECLTDIRLDNIFDTAAGYAAQGSYYRAFSAEIEMSLEYFKAGIPVDTGQAAAHIAVWITAFLVGAVSAACFAIHIYKAYSFKERSEQQDKLHGKQRPPCQFIYHYKNKAEKKAKQQAAVRQTAEGFRRQANEGQRKKILEKF